MKPNQLAEQLRRDSAESIRLASRLSSARDALNPSSVSARQHLNAAIVLLLNTGDALARAADAVGVIRDV